MSWRGTSVPVGTSSDRGLTDDGTSPIRPNLSLRDADRGHGLSNNAATSHVFGDEKAGFSRSYEYLGGLNFYPFDQRYFRVNAQVIYVNRSPASSVFGFYVGGQKGTTLSVATSLFF